MKREKQLRKPLKTQANAPVRKPNALASNKRLINYLLILLAVVTFAAFANALQNEFLTWDDGDYVYENVYIKDLSPDGIKAMFRVFVSCHYHPLTLVSLAIDYAIWGNKAGGYIFTNILLHVLTVLLVFVFFRRVSGRTEVAFVTAILFAFHPMRSESVIWVAERKDVLFSCFYFLALVVYTSYLRQLRSLKLYAGTLGIFVLALFAKATAVTLPVYMLLTDYYTGHRDYKRMVLEKLPFFALSIVFGLLAIKAQSLALPNNPPLAEHPFLITYALSFYLLKFAAPFYQSAVMPFPESANGILPIKYYISVLVIPALIFVFYKFKNYRKELIFGLGIFAATLFMVLIKFPIGPAYLAERYTYLPHTGIAFLVGTAYYNYTKQRGLKHNFSNLFFALLVLFSVFLFVKTVLRNTVWKDTYTLFSDVVAKNPEYAFAHNNRAHALAVKGMHKEALEHFALAIKYKPDFAEAYNNRATSYFALNDYENAIADLDISIQLTPDNPKIADMYNNRGMAYYHLGKFAEALPDLSKAIALKPNYIEPYKTRMNCYIELGKTDSAIADIDFILTIEKNNPEHFNKKGIILAEAGRTNEALAAFNQAITLNPGDASYYVNRGFVLSASDVNAACSDFSKAAGMGNQAGRDLFNLNCKP